MSSNRRKAESVGVNLIFFNIPVEIVLQVSTVPVLLILVGSKALSETLQTIGAASEELFRGDRLPIIPFPEQTESKSS